MNSRRKFLKGIGAASIAGLAGCDSQESGSTPEDSDGGSMEETETETTGSSSDSGSREYRFAVSMKSMGQAGLFVQGQAAKWYTQDMDNVGVNILDAQFDASETDPGRDQRDQPGRRRHPPEPLRRAGLGTDRGESDRRERPGDELRHRDAVEGHQDRGAVRPVRRRRGRRRAVHGDDRRNRASRIPGSSRASSTSRSTTSQERLFGFTENVPDSVEVVSRIESDGTPEDSAPDTQSALQANPDVDAIYSNNVGSGMGALTALDQMDMLHEKGHEDHVMAFGIDGGRNSTSGSATACTTSPSTSRSTCTRR